ncbi:MAG TPA: ABC transporter permease [Chloroflexota bacterium]|nr:ABC transporter permease [Chloroflexota bacterium]
MSWTKRGQRKRRWQRMVLALATVPLLLFLVVPILSLFVGLSLSRLEADLVGPVVVQAVTLSMITTIGTTAIALVAGTPVAYVLSRRQFPGRTFLDTLLDLPMVLPPAVAGIALLIAFGRQGIVGHYLNDIGIVVSFSTVAVIMAQTFVASPFYVKAAVAGFTGVERELEQAAALEMASPIQVFATVTIPLAAPALLGGMVMTWARALGEFGATIIFAGNFPGRTQTMPLAIYIGFEIDFEVAVTLAIILLVTSFAVLFVVKGILRRRIGEW